MSGFNLSDVTTRLILIIPDLLIGFAETHPFPWAEPDVFIPSWGVK
jgi:hypothetical protein